MNINQVEATNLIFKDLILESKVLISDLRLFLFFPQN